MNTGRWKDRGKIPVEIRLLGCRPAGETPLSAPIVQTAAAVTKTADYSMSFKFPAITIGGGGEQIGSAHSLEEVFDSTGSRKGTQVLAVALVPQ